MNQQQQKEPLSVRTYSREYITPKREGLKQWMASIKPTHFITFNFHDHYSIGKAEVAMNRWFERMHHRLFGRPPQMIEEVNRIALIGYPEITASGHIHYHAVARIPRSYFEYFCRVAAKRWKAIVKTSTLDIQEIGESPEDLASVTSYCTKSESAENWYVPMLATHQTLH